MSGLKRNNKANYKEWISTLEGRFLKWKANAERNSLKCKWELELGYIQALYEKQNGRCFYSGANMTFIPRSDFVISLDRIDSSIGYIKGNVVLCCADINYMKGPLDREKFILLCNYISKKHKREVNIK